MKNVGIAIEYKDGRSTILNLEKKMEYETGEILCEIFAGNALYIMRDKARVYPFYFPDGDAPITQDNVDNGEKFVVWGLLNDIDEEPVAAQLAASLFYRTVEKHRVIIGRSQEELDEYVKERNAAVLQDGRNEYIREALQLRNMHGFLLLCYAEYLATVLDSFRFFTSLAAVLSGTGSTFDKEQTEWLNEILSDYRKLDGIEARIRYDATEKSYGFVYTFDDPLSLVVFEYVQMQLRGTKLMKCQNPECQRFFVAKRKTAMYCNYPSPQDEARSCKQVYPQITSQKKRSGDEARKAYRTVQSRLLHRRSANPDLEKYEIAAEKLKAEYKEKKVALDSGVITLKEFKEWLNTYK